MSCECLGGISTSVEYDKSVNERTPPLRNWLCVDISEGCASFAPLDIVYSVV